jgi:hypothetical protein
MRYSPRNIKVACDHEGLTHVGGIHFFHEFVRVLQLRNFLATHLTYPRRNNRYHLSQMILALLYPMVLGLDRLETASFLRSNGTFQYLTGLPSFPDPQTLRRFLLQAPDGFWQQIHRVNDRLLQHFIHQPEHRSRLIFDLDSTVVTVFGHQDGAEIGYNPRYRGKRSYNPLLCIEANSSYLWDTELRPGNAGTWDGSLQLLDTCFANTPPDIREIRVRADAGFGFNPVFETLESRPTQYAVVARLTQALRRLLPGLRYQSANRDWEIAEFEHCPHGWPKARRFVVARRFIQPEEAETTLFAMGRYIIGPGSPPCRSPLSGSGIFTMAAPAWSHGFANCAKTSRCARFPQHPSPPTLCSWKSFAWPITWSRLFSGHAWTNLGKLSRYPSCDTSYSCYPASSLDPKIALYFASDPHL